MKTAKYSWFENEQDSDNFSFTVMHTEGAVETMIAVTDTAEKAHAIARAMNLQHEIEYVQPPQVTDTTPAISRERLATVIFSLGKEINAHKWNEALKLVDAILSELGAKPGQPPQPQPITMPTDEEIETTSFRIVVDTFTAGDCAERPGIQRYVKAGMFAMRSEIEKRMKGGEG